MVGECAASVHGQGSGHDPRMRRSEARSTMIDPKTNPGSEEHETIERYDLEVAPRVRNLPPYLFGRINELKYRKRRDGIDVIDLGMGNPTDPPGGVGHRQALRGRPRLAQPPLQCRDRHLQPAPRGRQALRIAVRRQPRSRPGGRRDDRLEGRLQPHVPGSPGAGRYGARARAELSDPHPRGRAGLRQRDLARCPRRLELSWRTSLGPARVCIPGRRSWSSTIPTTRRRRWSTGRSLRRSSPWRRSTASS